MLTDQQLSCLMEWANTFVASLYQKGSPLTPHEHQLALFSGVSEPEDVRVIEVSEMPSPPEELRDLAEMYLNPKNAAGLALGNLVLIKRTWGMSQDRHDRLLRHEFRHVHQFEQLGSLQAYLVEYLTQVFNFGYDQAPMELEARTYENGV